MKTANLSRWLCTAAAALCIALLTGCSVGTSTTGAGKGLVLVAGATGGTGRALVKGLGDQGYQVRAFVRDEKKARVVLGDDIGYAVGDVREIDSISAALDDVDYIISAIGSSPSDKSNNPEAVDYGGTKNLADAAAGTGVKQMVLVSSSGATQEDHFLNKAFDNVLIWKFKGEEALRASGVPYTVVRPGGLVNRPGGEFTVVFAQGDTTTGIISREDVALICIAALQNPAALNKTFETFSSDVEGENNWPSLFGALEAD